MRLRRDAKIELIQRVPLFSHCTKKELNAIAARADELSLPEGRELVRQGERGREFVVIVDGTADVRRNGRKINELGRGDFLGEIALLSGAPRTATVTTTSTARILVLTDSAFKQVTTELPSVLTRLLAALSARLHDDAF
jgi:CRP/FNR family transcriptional regulator, cyclic AMP receptor protein